MKGYKKWLAYGHMHDEKGRIVKDPKKSCMGKKKGGSKITIRGRPHKVEHS